MTNTINIQNIESLQQEAKQLLKSLIATSSFSKEEESTATIIETFLQTHSVKTLS